MKLLWLSWKMGIWSVWCNINKQKMCWAAVAKPDLLGHFSQLFWAEHVSRFRLTHHQIPTNSLHCAAQNSWQKWPSKLGFATVVRQSHFLKWHKTGKISFLGISTPVVSVYVKAWSQWFNSVDSKELSSWELNLKNSCKSVVFNCNMNHISLVILVL